MRVVILNQFYAPDLAATANLCASLAEHLAAGGHEVRVVTSRGGYVAESADARDADVANLTVHRLWTPRLGKGNLLFRLTDYGAFYLATLWRMLTLPRQDVIVTLTTPPLIGLAAVAHRVLHRRAKVVLWNMDCYPDIAETAGVVRRGGLVSRVVEWLQRRLFKRLDHVVTLDAAMAKLLRERYAPAKDPPGFTVVPNWEPYDRLPEPRLDEPSAAVTPEQPFIVLYSGNAGVGHRFETVLEAAERMQEDLIRFRFSGGGKRWPEVKEAAEQAGLGNVEMRGYVPEEELAAAFASAGCGLITLRDDSLGVMSPSKLHSLLAAGLPIVYVGPPGSNVDEAIAEFDCGISVRHGETDRLVDYLSRLMTDFSFRQSVRQNARSAFENRYCDRVTLTEFDAVLRAVAGDAG